MVVPVASFTLQDFKYLPEGSWFDYWTGKNYTGKRYIHVVTPLDTMPMFVKAGSIISCQPVMNYTGEKVVKQLTLEVYPGNGRFDLYEDDARSFAYQQGKLLAFSACLFDGGSLGLLRINRIYCF